LLRGRIWGITGCTSSIVDITSVVFLSVVKGCESKVFVGGQEVEGLIVCHPVPLHGQMVRTRDGPVLFILFHKAQNEQA